MSLTQTMISVLIGLTFSLHIVAKEENVSIPIKKFNRLINEKSPYLLQHAHNPINWYPWSDEAFATAKRENKPIFLSIGYSTCYWCHFMEKDSFEKEDVAAILNKYFISIKVDREERPDIDQIYMTALVSMSGSGGWPMSMFCTPDGSPFFGASTIQHNNLIKILTQIASEWKDDSSRIRRDGQSIASQLQTYLKSSFTAGDLDEQPLSAFFNIATKQFDSSNGGFGRGTKFPRPPVLMALLRVYRRSGNKKALNMVIQTLKSMARGGLHDILMGGFHRYSVDSKWEIPHFEKMLYDNAGLAMAYLEAYQVTKNREFWQIASQTLDWCLNEMSDTNGGFYSAQDAGDYGEEGDYYAWTYDEIKQLLTPDEFDYISKLFTITPAGNFDNHRNVFHIPIESQIPSIVNNEIYASIYKKLVAVRSARKHPRLDYKILTAWNGLIIAALSRGYQISGEEKYLVAAQKAAEFIKKYMVKTNGRLFRRWSDGEPGKRAVLNDYAFLIYGLTELYQSDFNSKWFSWILQLQEIQDKDFRDKHIGDYYFSDTVDINLFARTKIFDDMALPSGNSITILNLLRLSDFTSDETFRKKANDILRIMSKQMLGSAFAFPQTLIALDYSLDKSKEIVIIGPHDNPKTDELFKTIRKDFNPNQVIAWSDGKTNSNKITILEGKSMINDVPTCYVCELGTCKKPSTNLLEIRKTINEFVGLKLQ